MSVQFLELGFANAATAAHANDCNAMIVGAGLGLPSIFLALSNTAPTAWIVARNEKDQNGMVPGIVARHLPALSQKLSIRFGRNGRSGRDWRDTQSLNLLGKFGGHARN